MIKRWLTQQQQERGWSKTTFNRYHEMGRALFNWAIQEDHAERNPFTKIARLSTRGHERHREITPEQEQGLITALAQLAHVSDPVCWTTRRLNLGRL